ncbi:hypothetical protein TrCOL_g8846 [Triparma columacea]|uniref:peptidylprolyl isomerase n=1 Tax=Triparma columacea TaxID=722753 RepID=A0A9W7GEL7_9STRA|nr:hypothetical protein TrCOL_g8846 [Triparma columacea]
MELVVDGSVQEKDNNDSEDEEDAKRLAEEERKAVKRLKKEEAKRKQLELSETLKRQREEEGGGSAKKVKKDKKVKKEVMKERALQGGVKVKDFIIGSGSQASAGRSVSILYEGSLKKDGKVFDKNLNKKRPFKFRMGLEQVIKGMEVGLTGMRVGGERIVEIPPEMGYGKKKIGGIPPGSTLVFSIQLVDVEGRG